MTTPLPDPDDIEFVDTETPVADPELVEFDPTTVNED